MHYQKVILILALLSFTAWTHFPDPARAAKLSEETLQQKKEGWYPTGMPLANYSSDTGLGYGARAYFYFNGSRDDSYFSTTPFFAEIFAQFYKSTGGISYHCLSADFPYIMGTQFRLISYIDYDLALNSNYFGVGAASSDAGLRTPDGGSFRTYQSLNDTFIEQGTKAASRRKVHSYTRERFSWTTRLRRTWNEIASVSVGAYFSKASIDDWSGRDFKLEDSTELSEPTLLSLDSADLTGLDGGWVNSLSLALSYDTRDFAPNPTQGWVAEYVLERATSFIGSDYTYFRQTLLAAGAYSLWGRWILAGRIAFTDIQGEAPFYEMGLFNRSTGRDDGIGGARTGRGFLLRRFIGNTMVIAQWDNRFFVGDTVILGQRFGLQVLGFVDIGNVYDDPSQLFNKPRLNQLKVSYGGGFVIPWNLSTLVHAVVGWSSEGMAISMDFGHAF